MSTSLDKLENKENGYENGKQNKTEHTRQTFCDEQCELLSRKSVYPSDYICLDKLDEKQLPEKAFYSKLIDMKTMNIHKKFGNTLIWKPWEIIITFT